MKKSFTLILLALLCVCGFAQTIDPVLKQEMRQRRDDEKIKVIVVMNQQYDRQQLNRRAAHYVTRADRREFVVNELKQFAEASQYDLRRTLDEMERNDMTTAPKIIWMANAMYFSATKQAINDLAMRRDVGLIGLDEEKHVLFGEESTPASNTREITSNVTQVNADQVWDLGFTGQGVVVAVIDTGVNYNHLDLADHLWDGGDAYPNHGYDFYNEDNDPMDDNSHGTHCAGTVCGDGTAGSQTGMAPDATLMCVKVLSSGGGGSASTTCYAMQWAVEQGCDLFSMSLGWANSTITERTLFRNTCAAILDAGVVGAIAAGNEGDELGSFPIPDNVRAPGSCPPPYMDPIQANNIGGLSCTVCVGAVDVNDNAAYFTSNGPVTWTNTEFGDYPYTAGSTTDFGLIRPDVCAPGVSIKSAYYGSNDGYTTMSGTSMATPCTAGCISLLLSKNINATPEEICQVLEETAVPLADGKSNIYGYGRIDVLAAINAMHSGPLTLDSYTVNDSQGNNDGKLNAGESVTLSLTLTNESDLALNGATMTLTSESEYVTITDGLESLPSFNVGQTRTIENMFAFTLSNDAPAKRNIQFTGEIFAGGESLGTVRISVMVYGHILHFVEVTVLNDNNGNSSLEAGETADLHVVISNVGNDVAESVVGTLSTIYPYLTINDNNKSFGSMEVNEQASANFNVTLSAGAPDSYTIDFSLDLVDAAQRHTDVDFELWRKAITLTSNPAGAGTLSGAGYYGQGQTCTISATPNEGYAFVKWTLDGAVVSYLPSYTFEVTGEANYVADFQAFDNSVFIGDGSTTNAYLPTYSWYRYTLSQQIYTAEELNLDASDIGTVSFFNTTGAFTRDFTIYMVNTDKSSFNNSTDWIPVTEADMVYNGSVSLAGGSWTTIYFNAPFHYDGSSNVALIVDDNTGSYVSTMYCRASQTNSNQSIYIYSDNTNYDPYNPSSYYGNLPLVKNQIILGIPSFDYTINATADPAYGGTVSGGGQCFYGQPITLTAMPNEGYTFINWTVGDEVVSYLPEYSFSVTESADYVAHFMDMNDGCNIVFELFDSYGDGWNGNYLVVSYGGTTHQLTVESGSSATYMLPIPNGSAVDLSWIAGSWIGECSFTISYSTGLVIYNGSNMSGGFSTSFTVDCFSGNDGCDIVFELFDSYGDGYTGNYLVVNYGDITEQLTVGSGSYASYTLNIPEGAQVNLSWITGSYPEDCSFNVSYADGDVIYSGSNLDDSFSASFNVNCNGSDEACDIVIDLNDSYGDGYTGNYLVVNYGDITEQLTVESGSFASYTLSIPQGAQVNLSWITGSYPEDCSFTISYLNGTLIYIGSDLNDSFSASFVVDCETMPTLYYEIDAYANPEAYGSVGFNRSFDFEQQSIPSNWTNDEVYPWVVVTPDYEGYNGSFSLMSGNGGVHSSTSSIEMTYDFAEDGTISFLAGCWGEGNTWDVCSFFIDEVQQFSYGSLQSWSYYSFGVAAGTHTFRWSYSKDGSVHPVGDAFFVDDISFTGLASGNQYYALGETCTVTATANEGYSFYYWTENGQVVATTPVYSFTVTSDRNLEAFFSLPLNISVTTNMDEGGTASGGGTFDYGATCTLTATPNEGYLFLNWSVNGVVVSCNATYSFAVTEDAEVEAVFMLLEGTLIGSGELTNSYFPSYSFFRYTLSQQIYTPDEIGMSGIINSVAYYNAGETRTRTYDIYLVHTDKTVFDDNTDWITVSEADRVYSGSVTMTKGYWTTITFDTPFVYDGTSNLAVIVDDNTGSWTSPVMSCRVFNADGYQAIHVYGDNTNYDPNDPSGYTGTRYSVKNQVILSVNPMVEQTITLTAGWNWFSSHLEITLDDLKAALLTAFPDAGANALVIKSNGDGQTSWNSTAQMWIGGLTEMDLSQMYMIKVPADTEITLQGVTINPADHPVTIKNGVNWIAFPLSQSMTVTDAFAGFPANQDNIKSNGGGQATWNSNAGLWVGGLTILEPGKGYIYNSKATENKTFVFPTVRK